MSDTTPKYQVWTYYVEELQAEINKKAADGWKLDSIVENDVAGRKAFLVVLVK